MGAQLDYRVYEDVDKQEAEKLFDVAQRESEHRDGTSYSGAIGVMPKGVKWSNHACDNEEEAVRHIEYAHNKWDKAMGVEVIKDATECYVIGGWCSS